MPRRVPFARSRLHPVREARRIETYHEAASDSHAARLLRISTTRFALWRISRGLPAKNPRPAEGVTYLSPREHARRVEAYHADTTDGEAARALAMPRSAFRAWRDLQGLSAKRTRPARLDRAEEARRLAAYHDTDSDDAAARALGVGVGGFKWWRQQRGLPGKGMGGPVVSDGEDARRRSAYEEAANDIDAATRLGLTQSGFQRWRAKAGLPAKTPNKGQHVTPREQARRMRAYRAGGTDEDIAQRLGLKLATFRGWRQAQGLPPHRRLLQSAQ